MKKIKHQQQPTHNSCQSATIAMILDVPVQQVVDEFHHGYMEMDEEPHDYLASRGVNILFHMSSDRLVHWDKVYMLGVPSLNVEASTHSILMDTRQEVNGYGVLYDPNKGREGKKYYTTDEAIVKSEPLAVMLQSFVICYSFNDLEKKFTPKQNRNQ
jgi:hypothetical protein